MSTTFAKMPLRQYLWRVVAGLILLGTVVDLTLGLLFLTATKRTISYGGLKAIYWSPPAIERPSSFVHFLSVTNSVTAWGALVFTVLISLLLAFGLWKERLWAGCVITVLMLYSGVVLGIDWWRYFAADGAQGLRDFFKVGNGPALLWAVVIIALLSIGEIRGQTRRTAVSP